MSLRTIRVGHLAGIPIGIQPLWLVVVALITWSLGAVFYPQEVPGLSAVAAYGLGLLSALLFFVCILLHELGHALVARRHGVEIEEIDLWLLGGVARMGSYPETAGAELRFALAGPAVTMMIAAGFGLLALALPSTAPRALEAVVAYQLVVNVAILVFNLIPAFPLDGGRVVRALVWMKTGDLLGATATAASLGRGLGYGMLGFGLFATLVGAIGGLWLAAIGLFVVAAAKAEESGLEVGTALSGRAAGALMSHPAVVIPAAASVEGAIESYFVPHRHTAFPVVEDGEPVGLVDLQSVERVPVGRRALTSVGDVAVRERALLVRPSQDVAELFEQPAFQRVGRAVVLARGGPGILSATDVNRALRAWELTHRPQLRPRSAR